MSASDNSPTRMDPRPTNSARILARSSSFCVPHRTKLVCGHSFRRPYVLFSPHEGLVCGRLAIRPHTSFHARRGGWCVGVYHFAHTPVSSPTPKAGSCHVFLQVHGNCPSFACKQMATLFTRVVMCFCMVHGNCRSVHVSRWQLFLLHGNCPSVLVSTWQLSLLPEHVFLPCLFVVLHGNCLVLVGGNS